MGKTVESFRIALEGEIARWRGFEWALRESDSEAFDGLMDMRRSYASEGSNTTSPTVFEPMAFEHPDSRMPELYKILATNRTEKRGNYNDKI
jgi:hypothetical protein